MALSFLRSFLPGGQRNVLVAVDVGVSAVRALRVRRDGTDLVLEGFRVARLRGGRSLDDACREVLDLRLANETVAVSTASSEAAVRKIELPPMDATELRQALPWEARRHVAGLSEDTVLDAQVLSPGSDAGPMEVLLVAYPRAQYAMLESLFAGLEIEPAFIDVHQLATLNALAWRGPAAGGPVALLDLGSAVGSFAIFSRRDLILLRDLSPRVTQANGLLFRALGIDEAGLDVLRTTGKLPDGKPIPRGALPAALTDVVAELAEDIRSGLVYLENKTATALDHVFLTGTLSGLLERSGVTAAIGAESGITLDRFDPFAEMRLGIVDELALKVTRSELCAAAGVAVRFFAAGEGR